MVVADGLSTDRTVEIVERMTEQYPDLVCMKNPRRLQSAAINAVVVRARAATGAFTWSAATPTPPIRRATYARWSKAS